MPPHKSNPLSLVPTSVKHNAGRYKERLEGMGSDDRPLAMPRQDLITFATAWAEVVAMCPPGVLKQSDSLLVERLARIHMRLRNISVMEDLEGSLLPTIEAKHEKLFESLLVRLGGSPADRGKVHIPKAPEPTSDFD